MFLWPCLYFLKSKNLHRRNSSWNHMNHHSLGVKWTCYKMLKTESHITRLPLFLLPGAIKIPTTYFLPFTNSVLWACKRESLNTTDIGHNQHMTLEYSTLASRLLRESLLSLISEFSLALKYIYHVLLQEYKIRENISFSPRSITLLPWINYFFCALFS